jgi:hypothetical protein
MLNLCPRERFSHNLWHSNRENGDLIPVHMFHHDRDVPEFFNFKLYHMAQAWKIGTISLGHSTEYMSNCGFYLLFLLFYFYLFFRWPHSSYQGHSKDLAMDRKYWGRGELLSSIFMFPYGRMQLKYSWPLFALHIFLPLGEETCLLGEVGIKIWPLGSPSAFPWHLPPCRV